MKNLANELLEFINESHTAYHAVNTVKKILDGNGFKELKESEAWNLNKGDKCYVIKIDLIDIGKKSLPAQQAIFCLYLL